MNEIRERLKLILKSKSILTGSFKLASGKESSYYIDARLTTLDPEGANLIARMFLDRLARYDGLTAVGGPSSGADPMVGALVYGSYGLGRPLRGFIVRKKEKEHGTASLIEGGIGEGDEAAVVEDVITTGGSALRAVDLAEAAGARVVSVLSVVDRGEETEKVFSERGLDFFSVFRVCELL